MIQRPGENMSVWLSRYRAEVSADSWRWRKIPQSPLWRRWYRIHCKTWNWTKCPRINTAPRVSNRIRSNKAFTRWTRFRFKTKRVVKMKKDIIRCRIRTWSRGWIWTEVRRNCVTCWRFTAGYPTFTDPAGVMQVKLDTQKSHVIGPQVKYLYF